MRLHLLVLCDLRSSSTVLPSLLSRPVEPGSAPSKAQSRYVPTDCAFGGAGGNRTPVHDAFDLKELQQFFIPHRGVVSSSP